MGTLDIGAMKRHRAQRPRWIGGFVILTIASGLLFATSSIETAARPSKTGTRRAAAATSITVPTSSENSVSLDLLFENADRKIAERRGWLSDDHSEGQYFRGMEKGDIWLMFTPVLPCPWYFEKVPDSTIKHDGGKWLCGLGEMHKARQTPGRDYGKGVHYDGNPCVVYSMGSRNDFTFETRVRTLAPGCIIHTFDPTVERELRRGRAVYDEMHLDYGFGGVDDPSSGPFPIKSLETIMRELHHDHVDILKVDVEGYEFEFFEKVDWSKVSVGQLVVEVHIKSREMNAGYMNNVFNKLEEAGFYLIGGEPVTYRSMGQAELVFLNKRWRPSGMIPSTANIQVQ